MNRPPESAAGTRRNVWLAALAYLSIAVYATWPVARGLTRDVPWDLGDPLLNMWILSWDAEQLKAIFSGDFARIAHFFDANIFYPAPLTLAYSEHLIPQALQILPIYLLTGNPILCYNLLFLSTYVLSGVGGYLLVRELTGSWRAAFLGGLLFAMAPYRIPQSAHLQVLSSQWMAFSLYGFTRYLNTRRRLPLVGGALSFVLVCLSCNYYLPYFTPFLAAYVLWEIARRRLWSDRRLWVELSTAAVGVVALLIPFLAPYLLVRSRFDMTRGIEEVARYSADVFSYWTVLDIQSVWGSVLQTYPRDEGQLFPGAVPLLLGLLAFAFWLYDGWKAGVALPPKRRILSTVLGVLAMLTGLVVLVAIYERRIALDLGLFTLRVTSLGRVLILIVLLVAALLAASPRARARLRALVTTEGFVCLAIVAAWWLSLGPRPRALGRPLELPSPYAFLYDFVPGFDGPRVPARYAMILALMLAVAGAFAAARFLHRRGGLAALVALSLIFVMEAHAAPFGINGEGGGKGHVLPEARIYRPARASALYKRVAGLPREAVLLELPIGDPNWDIRAVYYSTAHWHRLVNGYSGFFPSTYGLVTLGLLDPARDEALATSVLRATGATHVIVHEVAFRQPEVEQIARWLKGNGTRLIARDGTDALYAVSR